MKNPETHWPKNWRSWIGAALNFIGILTSLIDGKEGLAVSTLIIANLLMFSEIERYEKIVARLEWLKR